MEGGGEIKKKNVNKSHEIRRRRRQKTTAAAAATTTRLEDEGRKRETHLNHSDNEVTNMQLILSIPVERVAD